MKFLHSLTAAALLATSVVPALAQDSTIDPESLTCAQYLTMGDDAKLQALDEMDKAANEGMATEDAMSDATLAAMASACQESPEIMAMDAMLTVMGE